MTTPNDKGSKMDRRHFLLIAAAGLVVGCQSMSGGGSSTAATGNQVVDAGPVTNYAKDGLYTRFRDNGFFVIRQGDQLFALSSYCTHRKCKLDAEKDHSFLCSCHGSTFTPTGKVTEGPAKQDLPTFPTVVSENGHLLVTVLNL